MSATAITTLSNQCLNIGFQTIAATIFLAYATPINTAVNATMQAMVSAQSNSSYTTVWTTTTNSYSGTNLFTSLQTVSTNATNLITEANLLAQVYTLGSSTTISNQGGLDNLLYHLNRCNLAYNQLADSIQTLMTVMGYTLVHVTDDNTASDLGTKSGATTIILNLSSEDQEIFVQLAINLSVAFNNIANAVNTQVNSVPSWSITGLSAIQVYLSYIAQQATEQSSYGTGLETSTKSQRDSILKTSLMPYQYSEYLAAQTALFESMYLNGEYLQDIYTAISTATISTSTPTTGTTPSNTPDLTPTLTSS